jgi:predicted NACHT family NTPase
MAILENFLAGFAANVAANLIQAAGSKIETKLQQPEVRKAVERCVKDASAALLTRVQEPTPEKQHQLLDCFQDAFKNRSISREFNKIFREKGPDAEELVYLFEEEADWNLKDLPWIDFKDGMQTFITAFLESAIREPRLNEIIRAEHLIQQTRLQRELLEEVRRIVAFLRNDNLRVVGINADQIQAHNVANEIVIHQIFQTDTQEKRAGAEEQHYLKTLIGDCDALDLAAIDEMCAADDKIGTSEVFTTLNLTGSGRLPEENVEEAILHGSAAKRDVEKEKEPIPIQAVEAIGAMARLVILGHPGGGKSTLVNYVAAQLALRRSDLNGGLQPLPGWTAEDRPIPVRIVLRRLAADMPDQTHQDGAWLVWDHLKNQLDKSGCEGFYEALRHILQEEGGVIFFDGLDEVMQTDDDPKRTRVRNALLSFSKPLEDKCKIIVTSREYAYNKSDEWRLPSTRFPVVTLDAFNDDQIKTFVETWYTIIGPRKGLEEAVTQKQADHLIGAIQSLPHLKELAQYPLLLTLMAQVHGTIGHLPENRADLYKRAINLLLAHWDNRLVREAGGACKVEKGLIMRLGVRLETLRASLERVAFTAHEKQENETARTGGCADIPMMDLLSELRKDLKSLGAAETVIEYIHERAGLLHALEAHFPAFQDMA